MAQVGLNDYFNWVPNHDIHPALEKLVDSQPDIFEIPDMIPRVPGSKGTGSRTNANVPQSAAVPVLNRRRRRASTVSDAGSTHRPNRTEMIKVSQSMEVKELISELKKAMIGMLGTKSIYSNAWFNHSQDTELLESIIAIMKGDARHRRNVYERSASSSTSEESDQPKAKKQKRGSVVSQADADRVRGVCKNHKIVVANRATCGACAVETATHVYRIMLKIAEIDPVRFGGCFSCPQRDKHSPLCFTDSCRMEGGDNCGKRLVSFISLVTAWLKDHDHPCTYDKGKATGWLERGGRKDHVSKIQTDFHLFYCSKTKCYVDVKDGAPPCTIDNHAYHKKRTAKDREREEATGQKPEACSKRYGQRGLLRVFRDIAESAV